MIDLSGLATTRPINVDVPLLNSNLVGSNQTAISDMNSLNEWRRCQEGGYKIRYSLDLYSLTMIMDHLQASTAASPDFLSACKPLVKTGDAFSFSQSCTINEFSPESMTAARPRSCISPSYRAKASTIGLPSRQCSLSAWQR